MKYWFDFEFEEDGLIIDPISVGFASEDNRTYYAEFAEYERNNAPEWLKSNVLPLLHGHTKTRTEIADDLLDFLGEGPEIWGWFGNYDWVALCQLYGTMMALPAGWPMFQLETMNYVKSKEQIIPRTTPCHHALLDALWQKEMWESLKLEG